MDKLSDWLDERTGYRALMEAALDEEIPGGARFAYVFGSALLAIFTVQVATGLLLMATYTPSVTGAWSSVFFIQHEVAGGWFVRGLHAYGAQAMVVVLGMHLLQVSLYGAYKKPREVTWWFGLALLGVVQGLALTGYLLPWDQKGYWATKVATNIAGTIPVVGPAMQTLVVGGIEYGQSTLTRFYVLHVGLLPLTLGLLTVVHVALMRRHGVTPPAGADLNKRGRFYPEQVAMDMLFSVLVIGAVAVLTTITHGGHLDAPADPAADYPPRPEWYFLFLFQLLKYLPGSMELLGTVVLPGVAMGFLFALPLLDRGEDRALRKRLHFLAPIGLGGVGIVVLTMMSMQDDAADADFQAARAKSHVRAERAIALAKQGIPPQGPLHMLATDPMTRGADVYGQYCQGCHQLGHEDQEAPDHAGFGSREWTLALMHDPQAKRFFGTTEIDEMEPMDDDLSDAQARAVAEYLFAEGHELQDPPYDAALAKQGRAVFEEECMDCHYYGSEGGDMFDGPNMRGYASRWWIYQQILDPGGAHQYGELNEMPAFADDMSEQDAKLVAAYLRQQRFAKPVPTAPAASAAPAAQDEPATPAD